MTEDKVLVKMVDDNIDGSFNSKNVGWITNDPHLSFPQPPPTNKSCVLYIR